MCKFVSSESLLLSKYLEIVLVLSLNYYDKCSKMLYTFFFLFSNEMLVIRAGIHKILVRIANREDTDQTAS